MGNELSFLFVFFVECQLGLHIRQFAEFADHQLCGAVPIKIDQNPFLRKKKC
jgi:hypothetical protein